MSGSRISAPASASHSGYLIGQRILKRQDVIAGRVLILTGIKTSQPDQRDSSALNI